ncbi:MAG: PAS domain S-box protein [Nitrospirae bacterium]|nr:PAS domain S-box protein [Nitrospirota bacterium]
MHSTTGQKQPEEQNAFRNLRDLSGPASRSFADPLYVLGLITVSIFAAETIVEVFAENGTNLPEALLNALLLLVIVFPALYVFILKPMRAYIAEYDNTLNVLSESEEKFRNLAEKSPNMIFINQKGRVVYANQICEEITGYTVERLCSPDFNFLALIAPEDIETVKENLRRHMNGEEVPVYDYGLITRDGTRIESMIATKLIRYRGGPAVLGIVTDITARKRAEEAYLERDEELRAIIESSTDGILVVDSPGRVIHTNRKFAEMWRIPDELIMTGSDEKLLNHVLDQLEDPDGFISKVSKLYESAESGFDILFFKDGRVFERYSNPLMLKGEVSGRVWAFRDISERVKVEEALIKANVEIESWNRELEMRVKEKSDELKKSQARIIQSEKFSAMGRLAAGLAHELNSPLAGLLPLIDKYRRKAENGSEAFNELTLMFKAGEHMAKVLKDFNSFSRDDKGDLVELSLNEIVEDSLIFSASQLKHLGINVIREYAEGLPPVKADRTGLQQVVLNMVSNARDAMPGGGEIFIKTGFTDDGNKVKMEFTDNGQGIGEETLDKIFDPFFTTKKHGDGMGLGLSVSYGIIKKHNGEISVESTQGKGTTFTVVLPVINT